MIPCFIPSKDRACQADLLLQSLERNASGLFDPWVFYTGSNEEYRKGYEILKDKWKRKDVWFIPEVNSEKQFYKWLELHDYIENGNGLVGLFADDCIFYKNTTITKQDIYHWFKNPSLFTFTFRLGQNISIKDYVVNEPAKKPNMYFGIENALWWYYESLDFWQLHGFAVGFDGYIYRPKDLLDLSERKSFGGIATWERFICKQFQEKGSDRKMMASPQCSEVFVQQINTTHNLGHRTTGQVNLTTQELNDLWLDGYEINLDSFDWSVTPNCTHGEKSFGFQQRK